MLSVDANGRPEALAFEAHKTLFIFVSAPLLLRFPLHVYAKYTNTFMSSSFLFKYSCSTSPSILCLMLATSGKKCFLTASMVSVFRAS